jgi:hypothetical protein
MINRPHSRRSSASSGSDSSCGPARVALPFAPPGDDQLPFLGARATRRARERFFREPWTRRRRTSISDLPTSAITDAGCGVLAGQRDHIALNGIDLSRGGARLARRDRRPWRWDAHGETLVS